MIPWGLTYSAHYHLIVRFQCNPICGVPDCDTAGPYPLCSVRCVPPGPGIWLCVGSPAGSTRECQAVALLTVGLLSETRRYIHFSPILKIPLNFFLCPYFTDLLYNTIRIGHSVLMGLTTSFSFSHFLQDFKHCFADKCICVCIHICLCILF